MEHLIEAWPLLVALFAAIFVGGYGLYRFINHPTSIQITKVKEWLLYAVTQAEKELGSGTGQIKLRYVYNMFMVRFPYLSRVVTFELFSDLVDEALDKFRDMLDTNPNLNTYVKGTTSNKL